VELHNDIVLKTCRTLANRNLQLQFIHNAICDTSRMTHQKLQKSKR